MTAAHDRARARAKAQRYGAPVFSPILVESDGLVIEGPVDLVLNAIGQGVRDTLYLSHVEDWGALSIRALIRVHARLEDQGLVVRHVDAGP